MVQGRLDSQLIVSPTSYSWRYLIFIDNAKNTAFNLNGGLNGSSSYTCAKDGAMSCSRRPPVWNCASS